MKKYLVVFLILFSFVQGFDHFTTINKAGTLAIAVNGGCCQFDTTGLNSEEFANKDHNEILIQLKDEKNFSYFQGLELRYGAAKNIVFGLGVKQLYSNISGQQPDDHYRQINTSINIIEINFYDHLIGSEFLSFYFGMGCSLLDFKVSDQLLGSEQSDAAVLETITDSGRNYGWQLIGGLELQPIKALSVFAEVRIRESVLLMTNYSSIDLSGTYFEIGIRRDLW